MTTTQKNLKDRLKAHLKNRGIDPFDEREDLPVGLVRKDAVPLRGSVHISEGRVASRKETDKRFSKVRFC